MTKVRMVVLLLLLTASVQCVRSIFYENFSYISLERYEAGTASLPYQERCLMVPVLRWAHENGRLSAIAARSNLHGRPGGVEQQSPEKLVLLAIGSVCVVGLGLLLSAEARRRKIEAWWLPWTLMLAVLYTSYAARAGENLWYPWDLPECFFFGVGTYFIARRWWLPLLLLMPVITLNRETAIFLPFLWMAAVWGTEPKFRTVVQTGLGVVAWAAVRMPVVLHYRHNSSEVGARLTDNLYTGLHAPLQWTQTASAFGFMLPVLFLYRTYLSPTSRRLFWGMMPCLGVILWYGIWYESRIFLEFTFLFALLASEAWENYQAVAAARQTVRPHVGAASM